MKKIQEIKAFFKGWSIQEEDHYYISFHAERYALVLDCCKKLAKSISSETLDILDIGPAFQTALIRNCLPQATVNTLGWHHPHIPLRAHEKHFHLDLNDSEFPEKRPSLPQHDIINFGEVIEHLYTSPIHVLNTLHQYIKPNGYLIIQTPNAIALHKRIQMVFGKNPYMMINHTRNNPAHFREYTMQEMKQFAEATHFKVVESSITNYFNPNKTFTQRFYKKLGAILPPSFREGLTLVLQKN